jgi:hypothetical protein
MRQWTYRAMAVVLAGAFPLAVPAVAQAAASLSLAGEVRIDSPKLLTVPVEATCDAVGQETTFIVVTVTQGRLQKGNFVEGEGDVLDVTCDSAPHTYDVVVPADRGAWRPGPASLTAIISYCVTENGSFNCTTQAFIPFGTPIELVRA